MAFANGSQTRVAYIAEATWGTTPATPVFQVLRATSSSMRSNKQVVTSDEIRADRNVADEILTGIAVSGDLSAELSYSSWDDLLAAALFGSWSTNVLKNGITPAYVTVEETYELGATDYYARFTGCMVDRLSMSITARQIVTLRASLMGKAETVDDAIISGATYTAANTKGVQAAPAGISAFTLSDSGGSLSAKVRSVNFELANNLRERPVIDSLYSQEMGVGRCDITGTIEAYFETNAVYEAMLDHDTGSLTMTIGDTTAEKYTILFPKIRFGAGQRSERNNTTDVMVTIPFRAIYDTTEACSIKITRAVA